MKKKSSSQRTVVVTGGSQGIGKGIAIYLLNKNYNVAIFDVDAKEGQAAERELTKMGSIRFFHCDISSETEVKKSVAAVVRQFGRLDGLVNNAANADPEEAPLERLEFAKWRKVFAVTVDGSFFCMKHALPHLRKNSGSIVNITSTRAYMAEPHTEAYCASKGAMLSLTRAAAISCGPAVRVNAVNPGWIDTSAMTSGGRRKKISAQAHQQHPVGRVGEPKDVAALVEFLLSDLSANMTGCDICTDGGMTRKMIYED